MNLDLATGLFLVIDLDSMVSKCCLTSEKPGGKFSK